MKIFALCFLAFVAGAMADCGCLKCNPNLRVMSPANAPVKIIFRNGNQNCPYRAPYTLQTAVPIDVAQPFVPTEYDYQLQVIPVGNPPLACGGSTYEYGLQAAVVPPEPAVAPLRNLRTNTERIVLDSPFCRYIGGSTCNTGTSCPAFENKPLAPPVPLRYPYRSRGPIFEVLNTNRCRRYEFKGNINGKCETCRQKRDIMDGRTYSLRQKRDILDLPMNFMFKFLPNLFKGPILHVLHSIQHNANPAVIKAKANANHQILKARAAKVKLKHNHLDHNFKDKTAIAKLGLNKRHKHLLNIPSHKIGKIPINKEDKDTEVVAKVRSHIQNKLQNHDSKKPFNHEDNKISTPTMDLWRDLLATLNPSKNSNFYKVGKLYSKLNMKENGEEKVINAKFPISNHPSKHILNRKLNHETNNISVQQSNPWKDLLIILNNSKKSFYDISKKSNSRQTGNKLKLTESEADELQNLLNRNGYTPEVIRNILLDKLRSFNEIHERKKRTILSKQALEIPNHHHHQKKIFQFEKDIKNNYIPSAKPTQISTYLFLQKLKKFNENFKRKKRSILLGSEEFSLPFFEIENEVLDNATNHMDNSEEILSFRHEHNKRHRHKQKHDEYEMESEEEIVGHSLHEHPFVVFLRAPLHFLQQFHDIRKNFRPILYSFPKLLRSSKRYLRDFGKNFQSGVLDFASNVIGDFDNTAPRRHNPLVPPRRPKRSVDVIPSRTDYSVNRKNHRQRRYILKVVDEDEVQEFLEEKLGGFFGEDNYKKSSIEEKSTKKGEKDYDEENATEDIHKKKTSEKKFVVRKLSPKVILDNNGKAFVEINGNKRPLFNGKHHHSATIPSKKANHKSDKEPMELESKDNDPPEHGINDKIDEVIEKAKRKLKDVDVVESCNSDEMPTQTVKAKIFQISADIQNLINLNFCEYNEIYEGLLKLENLRKLTTEYWKNVMINEKTNDIRCKIRILNYFREMQTEKDCVTKKIAELLKTTDKFIVKKMIKLLVRLQKLQCLIQKVVDHFDNRMKIGTISDTEREIKFVDYLSALNFVAGKNKEDLECTLNKEKNEALERGIKLLENLRILLQKDDSYTINEIAKQIWKMKNIEKLQHDTIAEMNTKLEENMKIRKELKILFDLLKQIEASEKTCENLLAKYDGHIVGSKNLHVPVKRIRERLNLAERLQKFRMNRKTPSSKVK